MLRNLLAEHCGDLGGPRPRPGAEPEAEDEDEVPAGQIIRWVVSAVPFPVVCLLCSIGGLMVLVQGMGSVHAFLQCCWNGRQEARLGVSGCRALHSAHCHVHPVTYLSPSCSGQELLMMLRGLNLGGFSGM